MSLLKAQSAACLTVSVDYILDRRKLVKTHRPARMEFLVADSYLCAETELEPVREPRRAVNVNASSVNLFPEFLGVSVIG